MSSFSSESHFVLVVSSSPLLFFPLTSVIVLSFSRINLKLFQFLPLTHKEEKKRTKKKKKRTQRKREANLSLAQKKSRFETHAKSGSQIWLCMYTYTLTDNVYNSLCDDFMCIYVVQVVFLLSGSCPCRNIF